jgi:hypothetical protein
MISLGAKSSQPSPTGVVQMLSGADHVSASPRGDQGDKVYGSAIFNRWLDDSYDETIVRRAWELSINQDSFAPGAYDKAIREYHGPGFSYEFASFAASTAEWKSPGAGVHEGATFPDVKRVNVTLPTDGSVVSGKLDHTAYALFDVAKTSAPKLQLSGSLPAGTAGAIMLVGRKGDAVWKTTSGVIPTGGKATVTLDDPGNYERVTAVVNGSIDKSGWNGTDWTWTRDQQPIALAAAAVTGGTTGPGTGGPTGPSGPGTGGPSRPGGGGVPSGPSGPGENPSTLLSLKLGAAPRLAKAKVLTLTAGSGTAGTFTAAASVDAATAKRLGLGRAAAVIGKGRLALPSGGSGTLKIALTSKARVRLKRSKKAVTVTVRITFKGAAGDTPTRSVRLKLKR